MHQNNRYRLIAALTGVVLFFAPFSLMAVGVVEDWVRYYNSPAGLSDDARRIVVDIDGNVYVTGISSGSTKYDYLTVKYNSSGEELWAARYNGPLSTNDYSWTLAVDKAGNVYVTGEVNSPGYTVDYATVKYNPLGVQEWVALYNGNANGLDRAVDIEVDREGNAYVTGYSARIELGLYDYATIKYSPSGDTLWVRRYNSPYGSDDDATALAIDDEGNVYVTGSSSKGGGGTWDFTTIKYNSTGVQQWVAVYNSSANKTDWATDIAVDKDGYVYVTGYSANEDSGEDFATVKYSPSGNEVWVRRYNGPGNGEDRPDAIAIDADGNVYVTGYSLGLNSKHDFVTIKYSSEGSMEWVQRYNGPGNEQDQARHVKIDSRGNVYVTGRSQGSGTGVDYATVAYNTNGETLYSVRYNGSGNSGDEAWCLDIDASGNIYVTGSSNMGDNDIDYATVKYALVQPDNWIKVATDTDYVGNNIYNLDGTDQTKTQSVGSFGKATYYVKVQNDGTTWDSIRVSGTPSNEKWKVRYYDVDLGSGREIDITDRVTEIPGTWPWAPTQLESGETWDIKVEVEPRFLIGSGSVYEVDIVSTSPRDNTQEDVVKAITTKTGGCLF